MNKTVAFWNMIQLITILEVIPNDFLEYMTSDQCWTYKKKFGMDSL
jgi:hypothetical protein